MADSRMNFLSLFGGFLRGMQQRQMFEQKRADLMANKKTPLLELYASIIGDKSAPPDAKNVAFQEYTKLLGHTPPNIDFNVPQPEKSLAEKGLELAGKHPSFVREFFEDEGEKQTKRDLEKAKLDTEKARNEYYQALSEYNRVRAKGATGAIPENLRLYQIQLRDQLNNELDTYEKELNNLSMMYSSAYSQANKDEIWKEIQKTKGKRDKIIQEIRKLKILPPDVPYWEGIQTEEFTEPEEQLEFDIEDFDINKYYNAPETGTIIRDYEGVKWRFKGGNPELPDNWERVE